jgi:hypothetical protein
LIVSGRVSSGCHRNVIPLANRTLKELPETLSLLAEFIKRQRLDADMQSGHKRFMFRSPDSCVIEYRDCEQPLPKPFLSQSLLAAIIIFSP